MRLGEVGDRGNKDRISSYSSFLMQLFLHYDHRDGRVPVHVYLPTQAHALTYLHAQTYRHTRACSLPAHMDVHLRAHSQYLLLISMVKISHSSRQRPLRSPHPPNSLAPL